MKRAALLLMICGFSFPAAAYFQMDLLKAKKNNVQAKQWTLADWLAQKSKQRLADQWLALHSSSNDFELALSAATEVYKMKTDSAGQITSTDQYGQVYRADFFASIFDLGGEFERNNQRQEAYGGAFGLRLLGTSAQSTNLVARYGWRRLNSFAAQEHWENQYVEGLVRLYIFGFFGLDGGYRHYFKANSNLGNELSGHRASGGAFLEFSIVRIYGSLFWEPVPVENYGTVSKHERDGYEAGITLIF